MAQSEETHDQDARLEWLQHRLVETGQVMVKHATRALKVSRMTIHRDLDVLHSRGVLRKVRGGATAAWSTSFESQPVVREGAAKLQKSAIGKTATGLVPRGAVIICDESTTALSLINHLKSTDMVTVITNFVIAIDAIVANPGGRLVVIGGDYQPRFRAMVGTLAERALAEIHADIAFVSCMGIRGGELYHQDQEIVALKRTMLDRATIRVLLVDSSKLGSVALYRICNVSHFHHIVVDDGVSPADLAQLRESRATVHIARTIVSAEAGKP